MTSLLDRDAAWCRRYLGKGLGDIPLRSPENRCDLCQMIFKTKLEPDYDPRLVRKGLRPQRCFRGWCCGGCRALLSWIDRVGEKTVFEFLGRSPVCGGTRRQPPADGLCELCRKMPWRHREHEHLEGLGITFSESQRGYTCRACNTSKLAQVDRIGTTTLRDYLGRVVNKVP